MISNRDQIRTVEKSNQFSASPILHLECANCGTAIRHSPPYDPTNRTLTLCLCLQDLWDTCWKKKTIVLVSGYSEDRGIHKSTHKKNCFSTKTFIASLVQLYLATCWENKQWEEGYEKTTSLCLLQLVSPFPGFLLGS